MNRAELRSPSFQQRSLFGTLHMINAVERCLARSILATFLALLATVSGPVDRARSETVRVMTFNLWHGGDAGKQSLEQTAAVIRASRADIVGLQETHGLAPEGERRPNRAKELATSLGWHYLDQGGRTGIISRYRIANATPKQWGAQLTLSSGRPFYVFNVHLAASPYQPYQLVQIPYGDADFISTEDEAVKAAIETRGTKVAEMLAELKASVPDDAPVAITGDFNEPSHLDWTASAVKHDCCPLEVCWPSTHAVALAGFSDAYRSVHPNPVERRGLTWTPTTQINDPDDRHDRIDFVFVGHLEHCDARLNDAKTIGESDEFADIVVTPFPSDHRAVVAEIVFPRDQKEPQGN